jgi:hypothetical protein
MKMRFIVSFVLGLLPALSSPLLAAQGPEKFTVSEFTFLRPPDWEWVKTASPMRKAQLAVSDAKSKEPAEVVFFYFGPANGGGTQANIDRWLGQFKEPKDKLNSKVEPVQVGKRKVTYVQAEGTYLSGSPFGPKTPRPGFMLVGAILESGRGNVFVKMTGPLTLTKSAEPDFKKMVESALR